MECVKEALMQKDSEGTSMRTIAEKAGYTMRMVYARFADKRRFIKELVDSVSDTKTYKQTTPQMPHNSKKSFLRSDIKKNKKDTVDTCHERENIRYKAFFAAF